MGKPPQSYDYPEVHPPVSQQPPQQLQDDAPSPVGYYQNRYSWMDNQGQAERDRHTQAGYTQSTAPPLPVVPDHLNSTHDSQRQNTIQEQQLHAQYQQHILRQQHEQYQQQLILQQQQQQQQLQQQHQQRQQQQHQDYRSQDRHIAQSQTSHVPQHPYNMVQPDHHVTTTSSTHPQNCTRIEDTAHDQPHRHRPDPIKKRDSDYKAPLMPDENPLSSPSSPSFAKQQQLTRSTTNMNVIEPPPNMNFSVTNYAPAPQVCRGGTWQHGLCSCAETSICMTGLFCPCVLYGKTQYRLSQRSQRKDPTNLLGYSAVNGSCIAWGLLCGINGIMSAIQRTRVRKAYEMDQSSGSCFHDCVEGCCCCCCALAQNEKEVRYREEDGRRGGFPGGAIGSTAAYVSPGEMTFAPPPAR